VENRKQQLKKHIHPVWICLIWLILISLLLPGSSFGKSILWKSEKDGHTLYLMGSIHVLKQSNYPLAQAMEDAYLNSDLIAFEVDIAESESVATQQLFLQHGMFHNGQTLQKNISPETFQDLRQYLATIQLSPNLFNRMKPPLCAMTITIMEMQHLGFDAQYGLDRYFNSKAQADGKKTDALETIEFQVKLFFDQSRSQQELFLKQTLTEMKQLKDIMKKMETAWLTGNTADLSSILLASFADFPEFQEQLLLQRNRNWIPKIIQLHNHNQSTLIIVGAAHLVGEGSIIELLTNQGYIFKQL
jgi:uncharacterized protein YbaP (TraB family)